MKTLLEFLQGTFLLETLKEEDYHIEMGMMTIDKLLARFNDRTIPWVIWDTETTGINPMASQIIEIAAYRMEFGKQPDSQTITYFHQKSALGAAALKKQAEEREWLKHNPPGPNYKSVDDLVKMTQYDRKDYQDPVSKKKYEIPVMPFETMVDNFMKFLDHKDKILLCAHNQAFDLGHLKESLKQMGRELPVDRYVLLDTLALGRVYFLPLVQKIATVGKGADRKEADRIILTMMGKDEKSGEMRAMHKLGVYMNVFKDAIAKISAEAGADHHSALFDSFNLSVVASEMMMYLNRNKQYADRDYYDVVRSVAMKQYKRRFNK